MRKLYRDARESLGIEQNACGRHDDGGLDARVRWRQFPSRPRDARWHPTAIGGAELVIVGMLFAVFAPQRVFGPTADRGERGVAAGGVADHADAVRIDRFLQLWIGQHDVERLLHLPWASGELDVAAAAADIIQAVAGVLDRGDHEAVAKERSAGSGLARARHCGRH